ncbi:hypothetical protein [Brevibacillus sp. H7]|uniref:hypothetical protein n=1 Tax=Brevibacillus sp. H7 TaxID=3349138 RepID=UPI00382EC038
MDKQLEMFQEKVLHICYAFYRYEINNGLSHLESMIPQLTELLSQHTVQGEHLNEINNLLEMVLVAVEKKDFLIAADLLKYELLKRILSVNSYSA